jgi:hypothetical protein
LLPFCSFVAAASWNMDMFLSCGAAYFPSLVVVLSFRAFSSALCYAELVLVMLVCADAVLLCCCVVMFIVLLCCFLYCCCCGLLACHHDKLLSQ